MCRATDDTDVLGWYDDKIKSIGFNKNSLGDWNATIAMYDARVKSKHFPAGTNADSVFYHEIGHRVWDARGGGSLAPAVKSVYQKMGYGFISPQQMYNKLPDFLSKYAKENTKPAFQEALAESFSEWYNASKPRDFCRLLLEEVGLI